MGTTTLLALGIATGIAFYAKNTGSSYWGIAFALAASSAGQIVLYLAYKSLVHRWFVAPTKILPYPKSGSFFLGNLIPFIVEPWGFCLERWQTVIPNTKSGFYRVLLGPWDILVPKSTKAIGAIMNQPYIFPKPKAVRDGLVETLGIGLVSAEGDVHRRQKKLLTPIFGLDRNKRLVPQIWAKALVLHEVMEKSIWKVGGVEVLHMHELTMAATLDVIGVTAVGVEFDSLRYPNQPILQAYQAVFPRRDKKQTRMQKFLGASLPAVISPHLLFKLPLRAIKRFHWGMEILQKFCVDVIEKKQQEIKNNPDDNEDVREKDILSAIIASGVTSDQELIDHLLTILAAAHESTAITLAWGLFKLAQMPDVQERLRQEIQEKIPHLNSETPSYETINSMPYLRCFLMELLRLYPAFPAIMREASKTTNVEDLQIQQGTRIMVSPYAINRNPELWGPDAREFRVERWLDSHSGGAKSPQAFMTFSSGQRICIGKDFAVISLKLFLAVLVNNFRFEEAVPGWHPPIQKGTSLKPIGLKVKISALK